MGQDKKDELMIPKSIIVRWLQESTDVPDFQRRLAHYVATTTNWTTGD